MKGALYKLFIFGTLLGACGGDDGSRYSRVDSGDPAYEELLDDSDIVCESDLTVSGTHTPAGTPPEGHSDCWAGGTWTFTVDIDRVGCSPQDELSDTYTYNVTWDEDSFGYAVENADDPDDVRANLKITITGTKCEGVFDHFWENDNVVVGFRPVLQEDGSLEGTGTFTVYEEDPFGVPEE